jgi:hypothetical protein
MSRQDTTLHTDGTSPKNNIPAAALIIKFELFTALASINASPRSAITHVIYDTVVSAPEIIEMKSPKGGMVKSEFPRVSIENAPTRTQNPFLTALSSMLSRMLFAFALSRFDANPLISFKRTIININK